MHLNWKPSQQPGVLIEATYTAYETAAGPAVATAKIAQHWSTYDYKTVVDDPYLKACGYGSPFVHLAKGWQFDLTKAQRVCETYGVEQATEYLDNIDIRIMYQRAFPHMLKAALDNQYGEDITYCVISCDRHAFTARVAVEDGGYEWHEYDIHWDEKTYEWHSYLT